MTALHELSLTGLVARLRDGTTTSVAIVEDCFQRIDAREATVGAWQHLERVTRALFTAYGFEELRVEADA